MEKQWKAASVNYVLHFPPSFTSLPPSSLPSIPLTTPSLNGGPGGMQAGKKGESQLAAYIWSIDHRARLTEQPSSVFETVG